MAREVPSICAACSESSPCSLRKAPAEPTDRIEPLAPIERIDPLDAIDKIEPAELIEASDATEKAEPAESTEPTDPADSAEAADLHDRTDHHDSDEGNHPDGRNDLAVMGSFIQRTVPANDRPTRRRGPVGWSPPGRRWHPA